MGVGEGEGIGVGVPVGVGESFSPFDGTIRTNGISGVGSAAALVGTKLRLQLCRCPARRGQPRQSVGRRPGRCCRWLLVQLGHPHSMES